MEEIIFMEDMIRKVKKNWIRKYMMNMRVPGEVIKDNIMVENPYDDLISKPFYVLHNSYISSYVHNKEGDPIIPQITYKYNHKYYTYTISHIDIEEENHYYQRMKESDK
jgi:hypothetical protein